MLRRRVDWEGELHVTVGVWSIFNISISQTRWGTRDSQWASQEDIVHGLVVVPRFVYYESPGLALKLLLLLPIIHLLQVFVAHSVLGDIYGWKIKLYDAVVINNIACRFPNHLGGGLEVLQVGSTFVIFPQTTESNAREWVEEEDCSFSSRLSYGSVLPLDPLAVILQPMDWISKGAISIGIPGKIDSVFAIQMFVWHVHIVQHSRMGHAWQRDGELWSTWLLILGEVSLSVFL